MENKKENLFGDPYPQLEEKNKNKVFTINDIKCNYGQFHNGTISTIPINIKISSWQNSQLEPDSNLRGDIQY